MSAQPATAPVELLVAVYIKQGKTDAAVDALEKGDCESEERLHAAAAAQLYSRKNERDKPNDFSVKL